MKNIRTSFTLPLLVVGHSDTNLVDEALLHQPKSNLTKVIAYSPFTNYRIFQHGVSSYVPAVR